MEQRSDKGQDKGPKNFTQFYTHFYMDNQILILFALRPKKNRFKYLGVLNGYQAGYLKIAKIGHMKNKHMIPTCNKEYQNQE